MVTVSLASELQQLKRDIFTSPVLVHNQAQAQAGGSKNRVTKLTCGGE
jgi:hypothetical protein